MGSAALRDHVATETAWTVERYWAAGLIICGRTNTPEFGNHCATEPSLLRYRIATGELSPTLRKTIPSAPTPEPRAQTARIVSTSASLPGGALRTSTKTKSFPEPVSL